MGRIVPLAVTGVFVYAVIKGCGSLPEPGERAGPDAAREPRVLAPAVMERAVLSGPEVPGGFVPAEGREVFGGLRPSDPDCARLLALADVRHGAQAAEGTRAAHAAFYRSSPPASLAEHVVRLAPGEASRYVARARGAAAGCPRIGGLERSRAERPPGVRDGVAVAYSGRSGDAGLGVLFARSRNDLLVLAASGAGASGNLVGGDGLGVSAVGKLRAFQLERARQAVRAAP